MMNFIRKLSLLFKYGPELEELLKARQLAACEKVRLARRNNLKLCLKHTQERQYGAYAEHNCDYCKLLTKFHDRTPTEY